MSKNVISLREDDQVALAINLFERCKISGAPVENAAGEYIGVVSKTDLVSRKLIEHVKAKQDLEDIPVRDVMNPVRPEVIRDNLPAQKAAEAMLRKHIHRLFVTDVGNKIIGTISSFDMLRLIEMEAAVPADRKPQAPKAPVAGRF